MVLIGQLIVFHLMKSTSYSLLFLDTKFRKGFHKLWNTTTYLSIFKMDFGKSNMCQLVLSLGRKVGV
jgi:hypothetical protein